ncbi:hypothetical protein SLS62_004308 [Diatrype stigma]|uniref:Anaphase-promoting complex subunit 2 n=1 Tax=Diatrype stigma TaxID=117547 RepID=A0AAN9UTJ3_9PEZI
MAMTAANTGTAWGVRKRKAIQSVFQTEISQPTPYSTPAGRYTVEQSQSFGGPLLALQQPQRTPRSWGAVGQSASPQQHSSQQQQQQLLATSPENDQQARFDRSWHVVTSRIALPASATAEDSFGSLPSYSQQHQQQQGAADDSGNGGGGVFDSALRDVLDPAARLPLAARTEDILVWHTQQVRLHFVGHVLPLLAVCDGHADQTQVLLGSIRTLEAARRQYLFGLSLVARAMRPDDSDRALGKFQRDLHAIVGNSMSDSLMSSLRTVLGQLMKVVLGIGGSAAAVGSVSQREGMPMIPASEVDRARKELSQLVDSLCDVGLAGERFQILFAELLDGMMVSYIQGSFAGVWEANTTEPNPKTWTPGRPNLQPRCIRVLSDWVENHYSRLAVEVTTRLGGVQVSWTDVEKWKEIAIGRLATLRIKELFDIVISYPNSEGGIEDLRFAVTTPQRRLQLTDAFSAALQKRLLHSGRSTLEILRTYIAMIRTFHKLDHSRVLLDRVAYSLQLYLCTREDTVRIIVTGLLSSPKEVHTDARKHKLVELVDLLYDPNQYRTERQDEEWDDLTWVPPPIDAGTNYKRRKSEDVIGTLIGALGSADVFIKEFQNIIGQRLLSEQVSFEQEVGVLDLLKKRFGDSSLQACDVMMRDIQDSRRLDGVIHRGALSQQQREQRGGEQEWTIHARILSRLFWPDMGEERLVLPASVARMQKMYESVFEHVKPTRKMKWLNHLGQATVELELGDRTLVEEVRTYEAAVIDCFSEDNANASSPWTFDDLWMKLEMDEDLLTAALEFWEAKQVLRKTEGGGYVVIERLDEAEGGGGGRGALAASPFGGAVTASPAAADKRSPAAAAAPGNRRGGAKSAKAAAGGSGGMSEKEKEKRQVYWQFVVGMLTNSGPAMPLGQIAMMMKMLIADGFPWSNEELQEFLGEKMAEGELELAGGKYKLVKK